MVVGLNSLAPALRGEGKCGDFLLFFRTFPFAFEPFDPTGETIVAQGGTPHPTSPRKGGRAAFKSFWRGRLAIRPSKKKSDLRMDWGFALHVRCLYFQSHTEVAVIVSKSTSTKKPIPTISAYGERSPMAGDRAETPGRSSCQGGRATSQPVRPHGSRPSVSWQRV
jgi:hypothetical protein